MKFNKDILRLLTLTASIASVITVFIAYSDYTTFDNKYFSVLVSGLLGALTSTYIAFFLRTLNKNPTPLKTAIIGLPRSGKTVYLSVLFNELQLHESNSVAFQPYGRDTIEEVEKNVRTLTSGQWLRPTSTDSVFYFRANAQLRGGLFKKKYTVEIGDYAGEKSKEFDSSSEEWLHKTDYFKYVISSDILFLVLDGDMIANNNHQGMQENQSALIAAFQVLLDEKGIGINTKFQIPVVLLILKSDLLPEDYDPLNAGHFDRLIKLCRNRCKYFTSYKVSSVGGIDDDGNPLSSLRPKNVADPMVWALRKVQL